VALPALPSSNPDQSRETPVTASKLTDFTYLWICPRMSPSPLCDYPANPSCWLNLSVGSASRHQLRHTHPSRGSDHQPRAAVRTPPPAFVSHQLVGQRAMAPKAEPPSRLLARLRHPPEREARSSLNLRSSVPKALRSR